MGLIRKFVKDVLNFEIVFVDVPGDRFLAIVETIAKIKEANHSMDITIAKMTETISK